jgi:hypothetical protein
MMTWHNRNVRVVAFIVLWQMPSQLLTGVL